MSEHVENNYAIELRRLSEHHWGPKLREIADHLEAVEQQLTYTKATLAAVRKELLVSRENLWAALELISKAMGGEK